MEVRGSGETNIRGSKKSGGSRKGGPRIVEGAE